MLVGLIAIDGQCALEQHVSKIVISDGIRSRYRRNRITRNKRPGVICSDRWPKKRWNKIELRGRDVVQIIDRVDIASRDVGGKIIDDNLFLLIAVYVGRKEAGLVGEPANHILDRS